MLSSLTQGRELADAIRHNAEELTVNGRHVVEQVRSKEHIVVECAVRLCHGTEL